MRVGETGPIPDMREEITGGKQCGGRKAHVLGNHRRMVIAAPFQIGHQLCVGQRVKVDGLQLPVCRDGRGFAFFVPIAKLLAPELLRENLFRALKTVGDFALRRHRPLIITEAVHVRDLDTVKQQAIESGKIVGAFFECRRMRLLPIMRHRTREVDGVLLPRAWAWGFKLEFHCHGMSVEVFRVHYLRIRHRMHSRSSFWECDTRIGYSCGLSRLAGTGKRNRDPRVVAKTQDYYDCPSLPSVYPRAWRSYGGPEGGEVRKRCVKGQLFQHTTSFMEHSSNLGG